MEVRDIIVYIIVIAIISILIIKVVGNAGREK